MNSRLTSVLASVTYWLAVLSGLAFLGKGASHMLDDGAVCVETGFWANARLVPGLPVAKGVEAAGSLTRLCRNSPSAGQRAADLGGELPWLLFGAVTLLLFSRLLKSVLKEGPFTEPVARQLTALGWVVAVGTPLAGLVVGWSRSWLVGSMAPVVGSGPELSGPMVLVLAGLAGVILGKIMREGVRMREDLEGTV
ncbi:DUF2975 domain-containing protein [Streptomyces sp. ITFR-6]|uniref:DUF2975 domain-containing protein n=1 Tax=Streptomyces sp. ITFR-6 TaxID=3075197 RepID=UPI002889D024|nr:DUF2975 domain-containing protein [Streptomyces sp. ITFR-6]WNI30756.1 DUF2975 domain-containing protein [Streptomyces sp. ITFR-6]